MLKLCAAGIGRRFPLVLLAAWLALIAMPVWGQPRHGGGDALLAIDQQRASVIERIVDTWGAPLARSGAHVSIDELRMRLQGLRADHLLAASLAGTLDTVREVIGANSAPMATAKPGFQQVKALGDSAADVVYTPVTPCRLVETRGVFPAVYQGNGTAAHTALPFTPNQIRNYTVQGGNDMCLSQLPAGLNASAVQLQVFGMPTTPASGDIEILPQGTAFGSTATMVYVGTIAFNTVSSNAKINLANNQISVQVRGGGAHLAIDVVGYFAAPTGNGGQFLRQGGNAFGTTATLGTLDNQPVVVLVNNQPTLRLSAVDDVTYTNVINVINGSPLNHVGAGVKGATIAGGGITINGSVQANEVDQLLGTVSGGAGNSANGVAAVVSGGYGNAASGQESMVPGGLFNTASGTFSFAAGRRAKATTTGTFMWADSQDFDFQPSVSNFFGVRATDGVGFTVAINPSNGAVTQFCNLLPGVASWQCVSDRNAKENFEDLDAADVLARVVAMPLSTWNFKGADPDIRSIGPMAQDFYAAFHLGNDDKSIATSNVASVALAAIQGLHQRMQQKDAEIEAQQREINALKKRMASVETMRDELGALKAALAAVRAGPSAFALSRNEFGRN